MGRIRKLYLSDYCLTPYTTIPHAGILCQDNKVIGIGGVSAFSQDEPGLEVIDMSGCYAMPGMIDCHVHGGGGFDAECALDPTQHLQDMSKKLASRGVTSFLPTLVGMPPAKLIPTVAKLSEMTMEEMPGAAPCGLHLEGPFINPVKRGTQAENACLPFDRGFASELFAAGHGRIKVVTFAPEIPGAEQLVEMMLENGIIPSMGHSIADEKETLRAIDAGARRCTHLFNGLPALHHRKSNLTDIVLTRDEVAVELILDGVHIGPRMVDMTTRIKPKNKVIGVSNAIEYTATSRKVEYNGKIYTKEGVIAGSAISLDTSWKNLRNYSHMPLGEAAACFTDNPAQDIGLITRGTLAPGKRADITFFSTENDSVIMTVANGITVFKAEK